jgi:hypothetical protein
MILVLPTCGSGVSDFQAEKSVVWPGIPDRHLPLIVAVTQQVHCTLGKPQVRASVKRLWLEDPDARPSSSVMYGKKRMI